MTPPVVPLSDQVHVWTAAFTLEDVGTAAEAGYRTLICNRPDGEAPGQPPAAALAEAAGKVGIGFAHVPFPSAGPDASSVAALRAHLNDEAPVLLFCRSGSRSTYLWALAVLEAGTPADEVAGAGARMGLDLSPLLRGR